MPPTIYRPTHQKQINSNDPLGNLSCTAYSAAIAVDRATIGGVIISGADIRIATDLSVAAIKKQHGMTLGNIEHAMNSFHVYIHDHTGDHFTDLIQSLENYQGIIAQGKYSAFGSYSSQPSYKGGHAVYLNNLDSKGTSILVYDPLANVARWIPVVVIENFMKALPAGNGIYYATIRQTPLIMVN
jgi:hypothetical protein